jgi:small GTP-binding protein
MGFLAKLFGKTEKKVSIAMCGLDNAGKTSILNYLKQGEFTDTIATMGVNHEKFKLEGLSMSVMDLGGQSAFRQFWSGFINRADMLIFVVDSTDFYRMNEAKEVFYQTINEHCDEQTPILLLSTKQDKDNTCSLAYLIQFFGLAKMFGRTVHVQKTSAKTGLGIYEAFQWIYDQTVTHNYQKKKSKRLSNYLSPKPI